MIFQASDKLALLKSLTVKLKYYSRFLESAIAVPSGGRSMAPAESGRLVLRYPISLLHGERFGYPAHLR